LRENGLKGASGSNPNPFYKIGEIKTPVVSPKAQLSSIRLPDEIIYHVNMQAGGKYVLVANQI